jgi:tetratricopeptide (TPR) repeat protein
MSKQRYFIVTLMCLAMLFLVVIPSFSYAQEESPKNPEVIKAIEKFRAGQLDESLAILQAELSRNPQDVEVHNALGIVYMNKNEYEKAEEHFDTAISQKERNYKAINNKLGMFLALENVSQAISFLEKILVQYPDYSTGWVNKAALEMQTGLYADSMISINKAIELDATDFDAFFKRGQLYLLLRQYDNATADFDRVLSLRPGFRLAEEGKAIVQKIKDKLDAGYIRVRQILVPDEEMAKNIHSELVAGGNFADLARQHSIDATAEIGGALGLVQPGGLIAILEEAMFALEPGELSEIVRSSRGYHIFLREE